MTRSPIQVGHAAPKFTLPAIGPELGEITVRSEDFYGRWLVLLFYPRDFSFVCPTELTSFSARLESFLQYNCTPLGVSIDSLESHREWMQTPTSQGGVSGLRFALASDIDGQVCKLYNVWHDAADLPNRGIFLVDPNGILKFSAIYDLSVGRNVDGILHILEALNAGGLCPANWSSADGVLDVAALLTAGRVLGHYKIEAELGRGSFGVVLRAFDLRLQRPVALKVFHKNLSEAESRLLSEARAAAGVNHPNVCRIYNVDVIDGIPTIVMEYLEGQSLDKCIKATLEEQEFLMIAQKLASGLAAAHSSGLMHRDIKPGNIVFRNDGEPVIVDFGLASVFAESRRGRLPTQSADQHRSLAPKLANLSVTAVKFAVQTSSSSLLSADNDLKMTETAEYVPVAIPNNARSAEQVTSSISGTPAYMSPEQVFGESISPASDVFSLGLIFVEMLTNRQVLASENPIAVFQLLADPDFLASIPMQVPHKYRGLVSSMIELDPKMRPTMETVIEELRELAISS